MSLFQQSVLKKFLTEVDQVKLQTAWESFRNIFHDLQIQENIRNLKEEEYQGGFLDDLFVKVLGYTLNPQPDFNLVLEKKSVTDATKSDGAILGNGEVVAVIELKDTSTTDLEKVTAQAFGYKHKHKNCVYVITSNFEKLRFYINDSVEHIEFNLFQLTEENFKLLWLCLAKRNLLAEIPFKVKQQSLVEEGVITKKLYSDYSQFKKDLFTDISNHNSQYSRVDLFKKTQKLLDRFLFILFAEDRLLLPPNFIIKITEDWKKLQTLRIEQTLYERFKLYFKDLNEGNNTEDIFAYNGGLFEPDEILDNLTIDNKILEKGVLQLSSYDYNTDVDVNILGHIFENSLAEIEEIQAELEGKPFEKRKTKKKKEGVYYTPRFVTKYIVQNTIGVLCIRKKYELGIDEENWAPARRKDSRKKLIQKLDNYREWLLQLSICDPACGSGAFLNASLEYLIEEHRMIDELKARIFKASIVYSDIENSILEHNLFGVDINEDATEIAKLSLWLRTAKKGRKLSNLSNNIKCGNSLIDDPNLGRAKSFNWKDKFPEVHSKGGFDIVIGNPPYGDYFSKEEKEYLILKYSKSYSGTFDLYIFFFELALSITRENGMLSFITPNTFIDYAQFSELRKTLTTGNNIGQIIGLKNVFEDAIVDNIIIVLCKAQKQADYFRGKIFKQFVKSIESTDLENIPSQNLHTTGFIIKTSGQFNFEKLFVNSVILGNYVKITQGITTGGNDCFIGEHHKFSIAKVPEDLLKKTLRGGDIDRYSITHGGEYILYATKKMDEHAHTKVSAFLEAYKEQLSEKRETKQGKLPWYCLHWPRNEDDYIEPKILIRQTADKIIAVLDVNGFYPIDSIHTFNLREKDEKALQKLQHLVGILNSSLFSFLYKWKLDESGKVYPQVKKVNIEWLPIKEATTNEHLAGYTSSVQQKNEELEDLRNKFFKYLQSDYLGVLFNDKISFWYNLEFNEFKDELNKTITKNDKTRLTKKDEIEWMEIFNEYKKQAIGLKGEINRIDKKIDEIVYRLYGLTASEIEIVENT